VSGKKAWRMKNIDERLIGVLWRIATSLTRNPLDVDDMMQEACIAICQAPEKQSRTFYIERGRSRMVDWLRKQTPRELHISWEQFESLLDERDMGNPYARRRRQARQDRMRQQYAPWQSVGHHGEGESRGGESVRR